MKNVIFLAVQGAGKGTVAKKLKDKYGYVHISTGDILRERASIEDELGRKIKQLIDNGLFVSDDIIFEAVEYRISQSDCDGGYILDGFPRNLSQAKGYEKILKKLNKDLGIVINLTIPYDCLKQRIIGRRICKKCGSIYNIYVDNLKPELDGVCDVCQGELYQRNDDNEESMKKRVDTYFEVTEPIIDYYKNKGLLKEVDSSRDPDEIFKDVEKVIMSDGVDN